MAGELDDHALVLRRVPYGEADLIVDLLLARSGRQSVFARSARKSTRRFAGGLEPLVLLEVRWKPARSGDLGTLAGSEAIERWHRITTHPLALALGAWWTAAVEGVLAPGQGAGDAFELAVRVLRWLDGATDSPERMLFGVMRAELRLLVDAGFWPVAGAVPPGSSWRFTASTGLIADADGRSLPGAVALGVAELELLEALVAGRFPPSLPVRPLLTLRRVMDLVWYSVLGTEPRARTYLSTVLADTFGPPVT